MTAVNSQPTNVGPCLLRLVRGVRQRFPGIPPLSSPRREGNHGGDILHVRKVLMLPGGKVASGELYAACMHAYKTCSFYNSTRLSLCW